MASMIAERQTFGHDRTVVQQPHRAGAVGSLAGATSASRGQFQTRSGSCEASTHPAETRRGERSESRRGRGARENPGAQQKTLEYATGFRSRAVMFVIHDAHAEQGEQPSDGAGEQIGAIDPRGRKAITRARHQRWKYGSAVSASSRAAGTAVGLRESAAVLCPSRSAPEPCDPASQKQDFPASHRRECANCESAADRQPDSRTARRRCVSLSNR